MQWPLFSPWRYILTESSFPKHIYIVTKMWIFINNSWFFFLILFFKEKHRSTLIVDPASGVTQMFLFPCFSLNGDTWNRVDLLKECFFGRERGRLLFKGDLLGLITFWPPFPSIDLATHIVILQHVGLGSHPGQGRINLLLKEQVQKFQMLLGKNKGDFFQRETSKKFQNYPPET